MQVSNTARRREEKKAKQQSSRRRHEVRLQRHVDDEFRKVLRGVEPLRCKSGTVVVEDLETLASVTELDRVLLREEKRAKAKPARERKRLELELECHLYGCCPGQPSDA